MRRPVVLLLLLSLFAIAVSQTETAFAKKLKALKTEYSKAQTQFYQDFEKQPEKDRADFYRKNNPSVRFADQAVALTREAKNDKAAPQAYEFAISVLQSADQPASLKKIANEALDKFAKNGGVNGLIAQLGYGYPFEKPEATAMLERVLKVTESEPMRIAATSAMAQLHKGWGEPKPEDEKIARKYLNELVTKWPNSPEGKGAKGDLFELDNLRVGKVFPDFEATDQDGKSWKLSDYLGKVVVVDFWGFW